MQNIENSGLFRCSIIALVLVCCAQMGASAQKNERPNILFISIDDLRTQLGAYGHKQMITPNLDRLASEARVFTRHFVQVPTCGPSRACLLTGRNLETTSDINHHHLARSLAGKPEPVRPETFIHHLKRNGYYTVGMGKISHSDNGHFRHDNKTGHELPHSWTEFIGLRDNPWNGGYLHAYGNGRRRVKGEINPAYEFLDVDDEGYPDGHLARAAVEQLEQLAEKQEPFFMAVGFYKPHLPFCAPGKYWDMYEHDAIELSPNPDLPENVSSVFLHNSNEFFGQYNHPEQGGAGIRLSDEYARNVIHANYASTTYIDAQVGKVLRKLEETGLDKNTIIIVWGDHGWHLGDHTIWGKHSPFERALNSTLLVKTPDMKKAGVKTYGLVASIDIYPTLCELTGVARPEELDGESFVPLLNNPKADGKEAVISYWRNILSMRTDRYRFVVYRDGEKQEMMLFDHKSDPNETINLADEKPELVLKLMDQLKGNNNGFLPEL